MDAYDNERALAIRRVLLELAAMELAFGLIAGGKLLAGATITPSPEGTYTDA